MKFLDPKFTIPFQTWRVMQNHLCCILMCGVIIVMCELWAYMSTLLTNQGIKLVTRDTPDDLAAKGYQNMPSENPSCFFLEWTIDYRLRTLLFFIIRTSVRRLNVHTFIHIVVCPFALLKSETRACARVSFLTNYDMIQDDLFTA